MQNLVASATTLKNQLISLMSPNIYHNMNTLFKAIEKHTSEDKTRGVIDLFQEELKLFVTWSSDRVKQETKRLVEQTKCAYLDKLLMRIISDEAKILTFGKSVAINYPSLNDYIHRVYIELAKNLYSNPHLFYNKGLTSFDAHKNYTCAMALIEKAMNGSIRHFLPLEDILDYTLELDEEPQTQYNNLESAYQHLTYKSDDEHSTYDNEESEEEAKDDIVEDDVVEDDVVVDVNDDDDDVDDDDDDDVVENDVDEGKSEDSFKFW